MGEMGWLAWLSVGAVSGWLVSRAMKTNRQQGLLLYIVLGIVGVFIGGLLLNQFDTAGVTSFDIWSVFVAFIVAFTGAVMMLAAIRLLSGRQLFV
jgi:uncharacterized membrane protein YeaQ/YmgE (transglycosylase-associated protein family)